MESQNDEPHHTAVSDPRTAWLINAISAELSHIAAEIDRFPIAHGHSYSSEEIELLQSIDLYVQKLTDIVSILRLISETAGHVEIDRKALSDSVIIEAMRSKVL